MDMKGMKNIACTTDINDDEYLDAKEVLTVLTDFVPSNKVTEPVELGIYVVVFCVYRVAFHFNFQVKTHVF